MDGVHDKLVGQPTLRKRCSKYFSRVVGRDTFHTVKGTQKRIPFPVFRGLGFPVYRLFSGFLMDGLSSLIFFISHEPYLARA